MRSVLSAIHLNPSMDLHVAVTGMHLMSEFGSTLEEIIKDGYSCHVINARHAGDSKDSMVLFLGIFIQEFVPLVKTSGRILS